MAEKTKLNRFTSAIAKAEKGKKSVSIGNIREVVNKINALTKGKLKEWIETEYNPDEEIEEGIEWQER